MAKRVLHGIFRSEWSNDSIVDTFAKLNLKSGAITLTESPDDGCEDRGGLEREVFIDADENEYDVCDCCHDHIMKSVMVNGIGHCVDEDIVCSDKHCESNEE